MDLIEFGCHKATLEAMNDQRHDGTLCDMKIVVDDGHVFAHRGVLAVCSPYFHTMFTGGFKEKELPMTEINMTEVFPNLETADSVIQSMYTGKLEVTPDNICTVYSACSFLLYDKPKPFCEDVMEKNLSLENCLEFWEATYYHNTLGKLHSVATDLLKNRFHDFFIYQDCLLEAPASTVSRLLKMGVTKFCSPRQTVTFLIRWFLKSDLKETDVLKQLVTEANLPTVSNLHVEHMMNDICFGSEPLRIAGSQRIQEIWAEVFGTLDFESSGKDKDLEMKELCSLEGRKRHLDTDINVINLGEFRKHIKKDLEGPSKRETHADKGRREPTDSCNNSIIESNSSKSDCVPACSSGIPSSCSSAADDWTQNTFNSDHGDLSRNLMEKPEKTDVLLAIAPSFTCLDENKHRYGQLKLYAYILSSHHWIDLGTTDYPVDPHCNETISVSSSQLHAVGGKVFISDGYNLCFFHLSSSEWKWVEGLPGEGVQIRGVGWIIFPLSVNNALYLMVLHEMTENTSDPQGGCSPPPNKYIRMEPLADHGRVVFGKITENGLWEEIICYDHDVDQKGSQIPASITYGPCWTENSFFLIEKWTIILDHADQKLKIGGVLCFDPQNEDVKFVPFIGPDEMEEYFPQQRTLSVELDNWMYLWQTPDIYLDFPSLSPSPLAIMERYQTTRNKQGGLVEKVYIPFPERNSSGRFHHLPYVGISQGQNSVEVPESQIFAATGSCLWRFSNTSEPRSCLEELNIKTPGVVIEHTPPPCNVILAVTGTSLDQAFCTDKSLARFNHIHVPTDRPKRHWDETDESL